MGGLVIRRKVSLGLKVISYGAQSSQNLFQTDVQTTFMGSNEAGKPARTGKWQEGPPPLRLAWKCLSHFESVPQLPSGANPISTVGLQQDGSVLLAVVTSADSQYSAGSGCSLADTQALSKDFTLVVTKAVGSIVSRRKLSLGHPPLWVAPLAPDPVLFRPSSPSGYIKASSLSEHSPTSYLSL